MAFRLVSRCGALGVAFLLAACTSSSNAPNPALVDGSGVDSAFIVGATQSSNAEISAAKLALQKSSNPDVQAFAQEMIAQHTQQESALTPVAAAAQNPVPPPSSLNPQQQQMAQTLMATAEPAFDGVYINGEIAGHLDNLANNFNPEIASGTSAGIVSYAKTYLPQIQMHLQMAQQIKAKYSL